MILSGYERETIINYNELDQEASVYTCNNALRRKLKKYCEDHPEDIECVKDTENYSEFNLPKKWVKISPPRQISEEAKEAAKKRLQEYWDNKKGEET